jgi:23S rRNA (adenine2503-C2)-methyltransferase
MPPDLLALPLDRLADHLERLGVGAHHAPRVFRGLHRDRLALHAIPDLGRHADTLAAHTITTRPVVEAVHDNPDQTRKLVLRFADGARVEAVLVPMRADRATLCVSSQVGCAMGCTFCATGTLGLTRSLTAGEIVAQVHAARDHLKGGPRRLTRLVFMGMGEPLHAYESVVDAVRILLDDHGLCLGAKQITVSTVGLVPRLRQLARDTGGRIQLAISLHAGTDATRARIVPIARRTSLADLREAVHAWPLPGSRAVMVEYVLLPGVNTADAELDGVAWFMDGLRGIVNLIPFNPFPGAGFRSPTPAEARDVQQRLQARGVAASIRWPRGREVSGACGQLMLATDGGRA